MRIKQNTVYTLYNFYNAAYTFAKFINLMPINHAFKMVQFFITTAKLFKSVYFYNKQRHPLRYAIKFKGMLGRKLLMKIEFQNPIDHNKKDGVSYKKEIDVC